MTVSVFKKMAAIGLVAVALGGVLGGIIGDGGRRAGAGGCAGRQRIVGSL
jgi:hypothetical protein